MSLLSGDGVVKIRLATRSKFLWLKSAPLRVLHLNMLVENAVKVENDTKQ